uniref:Integrase catalytic domain-containing protein n=1 Tax=Cacopsylla melanoneura TaxID=428564 RepID=A0A8D8X4X1_9HEMI
MSKVESLFPFVEEGLTRLKTKVSNREDDKDFCYPIVLPGEHPVVQRLVMDVHIESCHVGAQILLSILRQKYWITGGRRTVRKILNRCVVCKRFTAKSIQTEATPLPLDRVRLAQVFEVTGVDLAGPLYVKTDSGETKKVWVCLFTCAVYRAVRLELVSSLSTDSFIMALKRFCSRQNRPSIMYSDQGSNFTGFENASKELDWNAITSYTSSRKIEWRFNPPSSPWWGGWWERLIGVMKSVLKKVLGRTFVSQEVLQTILCDIESIMNLRPLTYLSEDPSDLAVLTPAMFLHEIQEVGVPEWDLIQPSDLRKRYHHRQELVRRLRERFRTEYLGQLKLFASKKSEHEVKLGDLVLIGDDNLKKIDWPVGLVTELIKGRDSVVRVVRVRTSNGTLMRPVQRIYPLEVHLDLDSNVKSTPEVDMSPGELTPHESVVYEPDDLVLSPGFEPETCTDKVELKSPTVRKETRIPIFTRPQITRCGRVISKPSRFD